MRRTFELIEAVFAGEDDSLSPLERARLYRGWPRLWLWQLEVLPDSPVLPFARKLRARLLRDLRRGRPVLEVSARDAVDTLVELAAMWDGRQRGLRTQRTRARALSLAARRKKRDDLVEQFGEGAINSVTVRAFLEKNPLFSKVTPDKQEDLIDAMVKRLKRGREK